MRENLYLVSAVLLLGACKPAAPKTPVQSPAYFELKSYISKEAARLQKLSPLVNKTVIVDQRPEQKQLRITDWKRELSVFSDADINKTAWLGAFKRTKTPELESYVCTDEKIPVKLLEIVYRKGRINRVRIQISNTNSLYTSSDTLLYYPDSMYQVKKTQHITLLNQKRYEVKGLFR